MAGELAREQHNAGLHLFSAKPELLEFGGQMYRLRSSRSSRLLSELVNQYRGEPNMPYTYEQYVKDYGDPLDRLLIFVQSLPADAKLKLLQSLPRDEIQRYLDQLKANESKPQPLPDNP